MLWVDAETNGAVVFLSQPNNPMGNFWGSTRDVRDAPLVPEEAGLRNRSIWVMHVQDWRTTRMFSIQTIERTCNSL